MTVRGGRNKTKNKKQTPNDDDKKKATSTIMKLSPAAVLAASAAISSMAAVSHAENATAGVNATAAAAAAASSTKNSTLAAGDQNQTSGYTELEFVPEAMDMDSEYLGGSDDFDDGASETWVGSFPGTADDEDGDVAIDNGDAMMMMMGDDGDDDADDENLFDTLFNFSDEDGEFLERRLDVAGGTTNESSSNATSSTSSGCLGSGCDDFARNMTQNKSFAARMEWSPPANVTAASPASGMNASVAAAAPPMNVSVVNVSGVINASAVVNSTSGAGANATK